MGFDGLMISVPPNVTFMQVFCIEIGGRIMQRRCDKNRKRSKKRAIYCPIHGCFLESRSPKHLLFADKAGQLQQRGMSRKNALIIVASQTAVLIPGEWLEAFWCEECQETKWYHVRKHEREYTVSLAPDELWQQVSGVIDPNGNPSVGEFTRRQARLTGSHCIKDFNCVC